MARVAKISKTTSATVTSSEIAPRQKRALPVIIVLTILLCLAVGIAGYFYYQYRNSSQVKDTKEIAELTQTLGKFMDLPADETPTLATVTDREKLADQPFFRKSENGDKVLIYTNSGRAILYRPSTKKIVDVTTINVNTPADTTPQTEAKAVVENTPLAPVVSNPTVVIYNGSTKVGVTNTLEDQIKAKFSNVSVVAKDKAVKNDYLDTIIVDISGKNGEMAKNIAESFGGSVGTLPSGEAVPDADILIIVGNK